MNKEISNWWMYHGDAQHTGYAKSGCDINSSNAGQLELLKSVSLDGPVVSIPSIVDGFVFVGVANYQLATGGNGGAIYKIDVTTGDITAKFTWNLGSDLMDGHGFAGMGCSPAVVVPENGNIDDAKVYFSGFNGRVYCLTAKDMSLVWEIDLRHADASMNQPVTNIRGTAEDPQGENTYSAAAGWSSPVVVDGRVYVGIGEGENPYLGSFVFCLNADNGHVEWVYCTCQFEEGKPNQVNMIPSFALGLDLPGFSSFDAEPMVLGCSVWSSIAYSETYDRLYFGTGNAVPDGSLPSPGWSNGLMSLDASSGDFKGFFQVMMETNYRPSDNDIDVGASPTVFKRSGVDNAWPGTNPTIDREIVGFACKNGSYFLIDAEKMQLVSWRQLLPYYNNGLQIETVDPHQGTSLEAEPTPGVHPPFNPQVSNAQSNATQGENFHGSYSCAAIDPAGFRMFAGLGGSNYNFIGSGIDTPTTPFMRAFDMNTMSDVWPFDDHDPQRYKNAMPPMYTTAGECGLSSPAVANDVVFCTTNKVAIHAFDTKDGQHLWSSDFGMQTSGYSGGYGFSMGPAIYGNYVVAGALVMNQDGGVLNIYHLPENTGGQS